MKRFLLALIILFAFSFNTKAQIYMKGQPVPDTVKYALVISYNALGYGKAKFVDGKSRIKGFITDKNGKKINFHCTGDIIEFMEKHGYDYVDAYAIAYQSGNFPQRERLFVIFKKHED